MKGGLGMQSVIHGIDNNPAISEIQKLVYKKQN